MAMINLTDNLRNKSKLLSSWFSRTTKLERVGLVAILLLLLNSLFDFSLAVRPKPVLTKIFGLSTESATVPAVNLSSAESQSLNEADLTALVLPREGITLPVTWGDLGQQLQQAGVIDRAKLNELYASRGGLEPEMKKLLDENITDKLVITEYNASALLNLLWAFGLGNANDILEKGEMVDPQYGGAGGFASTGGWTLSQGDPMSHYAKHAFIKLSPEQQALVDKVSQNIYRPCCGNSTHFPDCNHGMAMLGLLQLMAAQGAGESQMYQAALAVNSYWFPDTYLTIAKYLQQKNLLGQAMAQDILGASYSSASGYQRVLAEVEPVKSQGGAGGCGV